MKISAEKIIELLELNSYSYKITGDFDKKKMFYFASIKDTIEDGFYFLIHQYIGQVEKIYNSVVLTDSDENPINGNTYIQVKNPQLVYYKITSFFAESQNSFIHPTAIIDKDAIIHPTAYIGPFCIIGKSVIGENVQLLHHITITDNVEIKKNTVIEGNSTIGARGMAWIWDENGERVIQTQFGGVEIGENCLLGTDITIVRGSLNEKTKVGNDTIIAHGTKIGHGSQIGNKVHFANNVSLAGNARISDRVFLGSASVVSSNVTIQEGCVVGAGAVVNKSHEQKNCTLAGVPAKVIKTNDFDSKLNGVPMSFKK